jgi:phosphohistidine swiveling domain-containing protein
MTMPKLSESVVHILPEPETEWSTVNASETFPGVQSPLTWTFSGYAAERIARGGFTRIGALSRAEESVPPDPRDRLMGIFYGQTAYNLDRLCNIGDRIPGSSDNAIEQQIFGTALRPPGRNCWRRYPVVAVKMPTAVIAAHRRLRAGDAHRRWRDAISNPPPNRVAALARLNEAFAWLGGLEYHAVLTLFAQGLWERVRVLADGADMTQAAQTLLADGAGSTESAMVRDLWSVSRQTMSLKAFLKEHGFHGPSKLDLALPSWREDPTPLGKLLELYQGIPDDQSPAALERRQKASAGEAEQELLAALPRSRRAVMRRLIGPARAAMRAREAGRCDVLRAADAARQAARGLAEMLTDDSVIASSADLYFLTWDELHAIPKNSGDLITERRKAHAYYTTVALPDRWTGDPQPVSTSSGRKPERWNQLSGVGASGGVAEGSCRIMHSSNDSDDLRAGEILVCRTTDPSWASYFFTASAVIIDIGGPLSHGAIVAREMGIPCVINVQDGTKLIKTGDRVRVDGDRGEVTLI